MFQERQTTHFFGIPKGTTTANLTNIVSTSRDASGDIWLKYTNPSGKTTSLNLGPAPEVIASPMPAHQVRALKIALATGYSVLAGEQYTFNVQIPQYLGYSECPYNLTASAMATTGISASQLLCKLAGSLVEQNYAIKKHTTQSLVKVALGVSTTLYHVTYEQGTVVDNTASPSTTTGNTFAYSWKLNDGTNEYYFENFDQLYAMKYGASMVISTSVVTVPASASTLSATFDAIYVIEDYQDWQWGIFEQKFVTLEKDKVRFDAVKANATDIHPTYVGWGTASDYTSTLNTTVPMTRTLADMEYQHVMNRFDGNFAGRREFMHLMSNQCVMQGMIGNGGINPSSDTACNVIRIRGKYRGDAGHDVQENYYEAIIAGEVVSSSDGLIITKAGLIASSGKVLSGMYKSATETYGTFTTYSSVSAV